MLEDNDFFSKSFKLLYFKNSIDIINYKEIIHFDNDLIIIKGDKLFKIAGDNLVISKLLKDEILINGNIKNISLGD